MKKFIGSLCSVCLLAACAGNTKAFHATFGQGAPNPYSAYFTGQTYLKGLNGYDETLKMPFANVVFEPCARTHWHKHTGGQILLVTDGEGRHQIRGRAVEVLRPGDVVIVPPDTEHWHGAAPDSWMSHVALSPNPESNKPIWLEPVTDEEYK